jgi:hypothetical protein
MDLFTSGSDLDLSVSLGHTGDAFPRENKIQVLKKLIKALYGLQGIKGSIFLCLCCLSVFLMCFRQCQLNLSIAM